MNINTKSTMRFAIVASFVLALLFALEGCKKEQPMTQQTSREPATSAARETEQAPASDLAMAVEQETCPVMEGHPINKALFVEYKGRRVYFCCQGCPERFLANPAQYVAKLPQFKE